MVLFQTKFVYKFNAFMRERVFTDQWILFSGRRLAFLLFLLGGLSLFSGLENIVERQTLPPKIAAQLLEQARNDFQQHRYDMAVRRCRELVRSDPKNVDAWEILAHSYWALGEPKQTLSAAEIILRLNPDHPVGHQLLKKIRSESKAKSARPSTKKSK